MTASYSASLLEAWNPNMSAYSTSIPYGEVRIRPALLPCAFVAPSTESLQMGGGGGGVSRRLSVLDRLC